MIDIKLTDAHIALKSSCMIIHSLSAGHEKVEEVLHAVFAYMIIDDNYSLLNILDRLFKLVSKFVCRA